MRKIGRNRQRETERRQTNKRKFFIRRAFKQKTNDHTDNNGVETQSQPCSDNGLGRMKH